MNTSTNTLAFDLTTEDINQENTNTMTAHKSAEVIALEEQLAAALKEIKSFKIGDARAALDKNIRKYILSREEQIAKAHLGANMQISDAIIGFNNEFETSLELADFKKVIKDAEYEALHGEIAGEEIATEEKTTSTKKITYTKGLSSSEKIRLAKVSGYSYDASTKEIVNTKDGVEKNRSNKLEGTINFNNPEIKGEKVILDKEQFVASFNVAAHA